jgi:hypothetical protein
MVTKGNLPKMAELFRLVIFLIIYPDNILMIPIAVDMTLPLKKHDKPTKHATHIVPKAVDSQVRGLSPFKIAMFGG